MLYDQLFAFEQEHCRKLELDLRKFKDKADGAERDKKFLEKNLTETKRDYEAKLKKEEVLA